MKTIVNTDEALTRVEQVPLPQRDAARFFRITHNLDANGPHGTNVEAYRAEAHAVLSEYEPYMSYLCFDPALFRRWRAFLAQFPHESDCREFLNRIEKLVAQEVRMSMPDAVFIGS